MELMWCASAAKNEPTPNITTRRDAPSKARISKNRDRVLFNSNWRSLHICLWRGSNLMQAASQRPTEIKLHQPLSLPHCHSMTLSTQRRLRLLVHSVTEYHVPGSEQACWQLGECGSSPCRNLARGNIQCRGRSREHRHVFGWGPHLLRIIRHGVQPPANNTGGSGSGLDQTRCVLPDILGRTAHCVGGRLHRTDGHTETRAGSEVQSETAEE